MKSRYLITALVSLFLIGPWAARPASAALTSLLDATPLSITPGELITLNLSITNIVPLFNVGQVGIDLFESGFIGGLTATFFSGDGQQQTVVTGNFSAATLTFTYSSPGTFSPFVVGILAEYDHVCSISQPLACSGLIERDDHFFASGPIVTVVPEPSTWAMMLLGFVGLSFAFRRSRRRVSLYLA